MRIAATTPDNGDLAPLSALTELRAIPPAVTKELKNPPMRFESPVAINSRLASISYFIC